MIAQRDNPFVGYWSFRDEDRSFYVIIRNDGDVSGLWASASMNRLDRGEWLLIEGGRQLKIAWENGYTDVLSWRGRNLVKYAFAPGTFEESAAESVSLGYRIDRDRVGRLTRENHFALRIQREVAAEEAAEDVRDHFLGSYLVQRERGEFALQLERGGVARASHHRRRAHSGEDTGTWCVTPQHTVEIQWASGYLDRLSIANVAGKEVLQIDSQSEQDRISGRVEFAAPLEPIGPAVARSYLGDHAVEVELPEAFVGVWQVNESDGSRSWFVLKRNGVARSNRIDWIDGIQEDRGSWQVVDDQIHIQWKSGQRSLLRHTFVGFESSTYRDAEDADPMPYTFVQAQKVEREAMDSYLAQMRAELISRDIEYARNAAIREMREEAIRRARAEATSHSRFSTSKGDAVTR